MLALTEEGQVHLWANPAKEGEAEDKPKKKKSVKRFAATF